MGSAVAGLKAGSVASLYFASAVSLFNILILLSFKSQVLSYLAQDPQCAASVNACFSTVIFPGIPLYDFVRTEVIAILFAVIIGIYFDYLPGPSYFRKTLLASIVMLLAMLFLNLVGIVSSELQLGLMVAFETVAAGLYALIMARLYRRFTREVDFQTAVPDAKLIVDKRNLTGKKRTLSVNSTHKVEASTNDKPFKVWRVSGGVQVKEPREAKSAILVTGDGVLKLT